MKITEKIRDMPANRRMTAAMVICGVTGLVLILISSFVPDGKEDIEEITADRSIAERSAAYREDTEKRLEDFLSSIEGAGEVKVYLTVNSDERYIYATEGRKNTSDNRTEEERKYVMIGSGNEKKALIETVEIPEISGAVIACTGGGSPAVCERLHKAVSAALGIPSNKIYVTMLG